ncbi:MAG: cytidylate kinase-like family protein [Nitrososphaerales archaeon]|jgi:cytidylate kinase
MTIITISRGSFSGGQNLAECVSQKLGYRCVSREVLAQATKDYGVEEEILSKALTEKPGILERMAAERSHYIAYIRAALINEVKDGNIVYHGNAGHFLLRDVPQVLKVRVVASMEYRIDAAMTRNHLGREEAIRYIEKKDEERASWTRFLYHVDWRNPDLYDMIINLDRMSLESACKLVCDAASLDEFKAPTDWEEVLANLIQGSQVRAAIAMNKETGKSDRAVEIEANSGVITIKGVIDSWKDAEKIEQMIQKMPGVNDVIFSGILLKRY